MDGWALSVDNPGEGGRGVDGRPAHRTRLSFSLTEGGGYVGLFPSLNTGRLCCPSSIHPCPPSSRWTGRPPRRPRCTRWSSGASSRSACLGGRPGADPTGRSAPYAPLPIQRLSISCRPDDVLGVLWIFLLSFSRRTASPVLVHQKIKQWGPSLRPLTPEHSNLVDLDSVGSLPFAPPRSPSPWASLRAQTLVRLRAPQGLFAVGWISCQSFGWPSTKPCNGIWDPRDEIFLRPRLYPSA